MKKLIAIALVAVALSSCGDDKKALKEVFVKNCMNASDPKNEKLHNAMKTYCDCAGEKVVNKFSKEEMASFNTMSESDMETKLMPVIKDCLSDLEKTMMAEAGAQEAGQETATEEPTPAAEPAH